jgi:hypothetical protein
LQRSGRARKHIDRQVEIEIHRPNGTHRARGRQGRA